MQHLEVSGAVRLIYRSLGVKGLKGTIPHLPRFPSREEPKYESLPRRPNVTRMVIHSDCHSTAHNLIR